jgi:hypothetical protein
MTLRFNEGKAIGAVLRRIEARDHASRVNDGEDQNDLEITKAPGMTRANPNWKTGMKCIITPETPPQSAASRRRCSRASWQAATSGLPYIRRGCRVRYLRA